MGVEVCGVTVRHGAERALSQGQQEWVGDGPRSGKDQVGLRLHCVVVCRPMPRFAGTWAEEPHLAGTEPMRMEGSKPGGPRHLCSLDLDPCGGGPPGFATASRGALSYR